MKKIPYSLIPTLLFIVISSLLLFKVPPGENLISENIDTLLGVITGALLVGTLVWDFIRFFPTKKWPKMQNGSGIAIGVALGVCFGIALDNLAIGIALGISLGVAFDSSTSEKNPKNK